MDWSWHTTRTQIAQHTHAPFMPHAYEQVMSHTHKRVKSRTRQQVMSHTHEKATSRTHEIVMSRTRQRFMSSRTEGTGALYERMCENLQQSCPKRSQVESAMHVTAMAIYERLVLLPGPRGSAQFVMVPIACHVIMPSAPTLPPLILQLFSRFPVFL